MTSPGNVGTRHVVATLYEIPDDGVLQVARGLKAALSKPNNSQAAKQCARERLQPMEASGGLDPRETHEDNVIIGHKVSGVMR